MLIQYTEQTKWRGSQNREVHRIRFRGLEDANANRFFFLLARFIELTFYSLLFKELFACLIFMFS